MKLWVIVFVACLILVVYAVPTFYEASIEKRILSTARLVTKDLIESRFFCVSKGVEYKITFITNDRQGYSIYNGDKLLKTVYLDQIGTDVVYSSLFKDKEVVFKPVRDPNATTLNDYYSIFVNDKTKEAKKDLKSVIQIYINKNSYEIKLFRAYSVQNNGDLVFKEI